MNEEGIKLNYNECLNVEKEITKLKRNVIRQKYHLRTKAGSKRLFMINVRKRIDRLPEKPHDFLMWGKVPKLLYAKKDYVAVPQIDFSITTRCNLRCKECFFRIPYYEHPVDIPTNILYKDINHLVASVDYIHKINLVGGEPFLRKNLPEIIRYVTSIKKIGMVLIITNGTIVPDDSLCKALLLPKVYLYVSNYGKHVSKAVPHIVKKIGASKIRFVIGTLKNWYHFEEPRKDNITQEELVNKLGSCSYKECRALFEGRFYPCSFACHAEEQGFVPSVEDDYIAIHDYSPPQLRKAIKEFYSRKSYPCCAYCTGPKKNESTPIRAGVQLQEAGYK